MPARALFPKSCRSALTDIQDLLNPEVEIIDGARQLVCRITAPNIAAAASSLAAAIVQRRVGMNERMRNVWFAQRDQAPEYTISGADQTLLIAAVLTNVGTPDEPAPELHLRGLLTESVWIAAATFLDTGLGVPIRVEGHDWSVTDPGGDGLTVYETEDGFCFRLWETKHHLAESAVRETVNEACRQVQDRSLSYLSRFSLIAQQLSSEPELAEFYALLAERWVNNDPAAGLGIAIGTDTSNQAGNCFANVHTYFDFPRERYDGHLHVVAGFSTLARTLRDELWKGCGLWIGP